MKWYLQLHYLKSSWYGFLINLGRGDKSLFMIKLAHFSYSLPRLFTARAARFINQSNITEQMNKTNSWGLGLTIDIDIIF